MNWALNHKVNLKYSLLSALIVIFAFYININFRDRSITIELSESFFWLTVPILVFSIITLFLKAEVFNSWIKFTKYYFIASVIIILITPTSSHGLDFFPIVKETVTIFLSALYSVISLFLIMSKFFKKSNPETLKLN